MAIFIKLYILGVVVSLLQNYHYEVIVKNRRGIIVTNPKLLLSWVNVILNLIRR